MNYAKLKCGREVEVVEIEYGARIEDTRIAVAFYCDVEGCEKDAQVTSEELEYLNEKYFDCLYRLYLERVEEKRVGGE